MITGWFAPELITIGEKTYLFYFDDTAKGLAYTSYADIGADVVEEDVDDDGTIDKRYLPESVFVGKRTEADKATLVGVAIDDIATEEYSSSAGILFLEKNAEEIAPYRDAFKAIGVNPNRYMCSIEALLDRIAKGKGFPHINALSSQ